MSEKNTKATETVEIDPGMSVMPEGPGLMDVPTVIPELDSMLAAMPPALPAYQTTVWKNKPSTETPVDAAVMTRVEQRLVDLTNAVNALRDSVSHIDAGVYIRTAAFTSGVAIRLNGAEWQTYFLFGSSNICAIIGQRGTGEPAVVNLTGIDLTVKRGPGTSIDVTTAIVNGVFVVMSAAPFTVTN
ncbi:hypothetical protein [Collinsella stercoris]|uniref:hypothetical protein n=1 Tax=Collinsella stercoris TaxID=147206 RepID=UPI003A8F88C4